MNTLDILWGTRVSKKSMGKSLSVSINLIAKFQLNNIISYKLIAALTVLCGMFKPYFDLYPLHKYIIDVALFKQEQCYLKIIISRQQFSKYLHESLADIHKVYLHTFELCFPLPDWFHFHGIQIAQIVVAIRIRCYIESGQTSGCVPATKRSVRAIWIE